MKKSMFKPLSIFLSLCLIFGMIGVIPVAAGPSLGYSVVGITPFDTNPSNEAEWYQTGDDAFIPIIFSGTQPSLSEFYIDGYDVDIDITSDEMPHIFISDAEVITSNGDIGVYLQFVDQIITTKTIEHYIDLTVTENGTTVASESGTLVVLPYREFITADNTLIDASPFGVLLDVLNPVKNVTVTMGSNVTMMIDFDKAEQSFVSLYSHDRYESCDHPAEAETLAKYPSIELVYEFSTVNMMRVPPDLAQLKFDLSQTYYVYGQNSLSSTWDGKLNYQGTTDDVIPYAYTEMFLLPVKLDLGTSSITPPTGNTSGSSSSSSKGSSGGGGAADGSTTSSSAVTTSNGIITLKGEISQVKAIEEANKAFSNQGTSGTATIQFKNTAEISPSTIQALADASEKAGKELVIHADTLSSNGSAVQGRLYIEPTKLGGITENINLGVFVEGKEAQAVTDTFIKYFDNTVSTVHLTQKGNFGGATVKVAAKVDVSKMDTASLRFYSYDNTSGKYTEIKNTNYFIDNNGYVHFFTSLAGDIVITDKPLSKK